MNYTLAQNNINVHTNKRCNDICLVFGPDICATVHESQTYVYTVTVASAPAVTGSASMWKARLLLGQCTVDYCWDSVL